MSIDYSDMAFPKTGKKKKRKIHKKSILNSQKGICYLCARLNGDYSVKQTEEHHILFGAGQRAISEENGLKVDLCIEHHRTGQQAVHNSHADPVLCKRLEEAGAACVMPLGAPIGSNKGLASRDFLRIIIEQSNVPVVVDAGIGAPSHAAEALEMGADAVLVNTAIAVAQDPVAMARAFRLAVEAGRTAFEAKLAPVSSAAHATSPIQPLLDDVLSLK